MQVLYRSWGNPEEHIKPDKLEAQIFHLKDINK